MASVLLGTLYPLFLDALNAGKISVGPPYFEAVFGPLMAPLVFLMGIGPLASWRRAELPGLWTRLRWALGVAIVDARSCCRSRSAAGRRSSPPGCSSRCGSSPRPSSTVVQRLRARAAGDARREAARELVVVVRHAARAPGRRRVHRRRHAGQGLRGRARRAPRSRPGSTEVGGYAFTFKGVSRRPGPELPGAGRHGRGATRRRAHRRARSRRSASTRRAASR